jgi:lactate dehydrogenase-like 2-hydroxyacid dehydrogenase
MRHYDNNERSMSATSSTSTGCDMIDANPCTAAGVIVVDQSGTNKEGIAEHTLGLILSLSKQIALSVGVIIDTGRSPQTRQKPVMDWSAGASYGGCARCAPCHPA